MFRLRILELINENGHVCISNGDGMVVTMDCIYGQYEIHGNNNDKHFGSQFFKSFYPAMNEVFKLFATERTMIKRII